MLKNVPYEYIYACVLLTNSYQRLFFLEYLQFFYAIGHLDHVILFLFPFSYVAHSVRKSLSVRLRVC